MDKDITVEVFFWGGGSASAIWYHDIGEKVDISIVNISKKKKTLKEPELIKTPPGKKKNVYFWFGV